MLEISAADLKSAMHTIGPVIKKSTMPILSHVLLRKEGDKATLSANNLESSITMNLNAQGDDMLCTIPGDKLMALTRRVPTSTPVKIKGDQSKAVLSAGRGRFEFVSLPPEEFPLPMEHHQALNASVPTSDFINALARAAVAKAENDVRLFLNGVNLIVGNEGITFVATNGHCLFVDETDVQSVKGEAQSGILPTNCVDATIKLLSGIEDETVDIQLGDKTFQVATNQGVLTSQLIDGNYPDWQRVLQVPSDSPIVAPRRELLDAVETAIIAQSELRFKAIEFTVESGGLTVEARNNDTKSSGVETLDCDYAGEDVRFAISASYLSNALKSAEGDTVNISCYGPHKPILITGNRPSFKATVAPLNS